MECYDRYFMIAVDLAFAGEEVRFEAVGKLKIFIMLLSECAWAIIL